MIGYRKKYFRQIHELFQKIRNDLDDLASLERIQVMIVKEILHTETKIKSFKTQLTDFNNHTTSEIKILRKQKFIERRIEGYRYLNFIWRSFGDAIAFLYLEKNALKQVYYNTKNINPKSDAGFITGKTGFDAEMSTLTELLKQDIPALLSDITNCIRHGDVCILIGPDPILHEVKSSKTKSSRTNRQKKDIQKLHSFFENDEIEGLRVSGETKRLEIPYSQDGYCAELNKCLRETKLNGYNISSPENGLYYVAIHDVKIKIDDIFKEINLNKPYVYFLNESKTKKEWSPYVSFVKSIEDTENLYDFIKGDLYIIVLFEQDIFAKIVKGTGYEIKIHNEEDDYFLSISKDEAYIRVATQLIARIAFDFSSPREIVAGSIIAFEYQSKLTDQFN